MQFESPTSLLALIAIPLLAMAAFVVALTRKSSWAPFAAPRLSQALLRFQSRTPLIVSFSLLLLASAGLIFALARPTAEGPKKSEKIQSRNVIFALDLSRSMRVTDVAPDRLTHAKVIISEIMEALPNDQVGLIGFAGDAYEFMPLTIDHNALTETLQQIDESWAPLGGSNLSEVISLASHSFKETGQKNNTLIILSDGEENDGSVTSVLDLAKRSGALIITIGVGTPNGGFVPHPNHPNAKFLDRSGTPVVSRLITTELQKLADATHGPCLIANSGTDIPATVKAALSQISSVEIQGKERTVTLELFQWFLFPAWILLFVAFLFGTRWSSVKLPVKSTALLLFLATCLFTHAKPSSLGTAHQAYQHDDFTLARSQYSTALLDPTPATRAAAHDGLGHTLFQFGWLFLASNRYPDSPPSDEDFDALVHAKLDELATATTSDLQPWQQLILNWSDAIRHFDSALTLNPNLHSAEHNRLLVVHYLIRLEKILNEEKQNHSNPPPPSQSPNSQDPQDPNHPDAQDQPKDPNSKSNPNQDPKSNPKNNGNPPPKNPNQPDPSKDPQAPKPDPDQKSDQQGKQSNRPNDLSPEEQAKSMLKENSDLEKGPISPGRRILKIPAKDW